SDECNALLRGGLVQRVVEIDEETIGMEIYANRERQYLVMSAESDHPRCLIVPDKVRRGVETPSPIGLLLRKYIDGARLNAITIPPWERILHFEFSNNEGDVTLIAEMVNRRANVIMTVGDEILDSIRRVGPRENSRRLILPSHTYVPPPPQDKALPEAVTPSLLAAWLEMEGEEQAWRVLVGHIAGVSPLFAREVIHRATEDARARAFDMAAEVVHGAFSDLIEQAKAGERTPCLVPDGEGFKAFAAYPLTHLGETVPAASISEAMARYFGAPVGTEAYEAAKSTVRAQIDDALDRARRKYRALERQSASPEKMEEMRKKGELVYAYMPTLSPGATEFEAQYDPDGPPLKVSIDPELSIAEKAQKYFDKYEKAKRAADEIPRRQAYAKIDLAYLEQLSTDLDMAENWPEIEAVREALQESGHWKGSRTRGPRGGKPGIRRLTTPDGFVIFIGRNARQNHKLVTERADSDDLWLHARSLPGSHVLIKFDGRPIPDEVIQQAAELAAYYSAARQDTSVEVDVTERRYVRPIKGAPPGLVTYRNEHTLTVQPRKAL
ncbi:MAG: NFACT family protein, partial [Anaerolineae bacterium]